MNCSCKQGRTPPCKCNGETPFDRPAFAVLYVLLGMALTATIILSAASLA